MRLLSAVAVFLTFSLTSALWCYESNDLYEGEQYERQCYGDEQPACITANWHMPYHDRDIMVKGCGSCEIMEMKADNIDGLDHKWCKECYYEGCNGDWEDGGHDGDWEDEEDWVSGAGCLQKMWSLVFPAVFLFVKFA